MFGDKKTFFGTTHRTMENVILGKNISEHDTHKSPLRNVYHELGSDME